MDFEVFMPYNSIHLEGFSMKTINDCNTLFELYKFYRVESNKDIDIPLGKRFFLEKGCQEFQFIGLHYFKNYLKEFGWGKNGKQFTEADVVSDFKSKNYGLLFAVPYSDPVDLERLCAMQIEFSLLSENQALNSQKNQKEIEYKELVKGKFTFKLQGCNRVFIHNFDYLCEPKFLLDKVSELKGAFKNAEVEAREKMIRESLLKDINKLNIDSNYTTQSFIEEAPRAVESFAPITPSVSSSSSASSTQPPIQPAAQNSSKKASNNIYDYLNNRYFTAGVAVCALCAIGVVACRYLNINVLEGLLRGGDKSLSI